MSRVVVRLACACLFCLLAVWPAEAADPMLTVVFTGNTLGVFRPCPTCEKNKTLGGLGRRAAFFKQLRRSRPSADSLLMLAGGHEFMPFRLRGKARPGMAESLAEAYAQLSYDFGYVTPREKAWIESDGGELPPGWAVAGPTPLRKTFGKGGMTVGVVVFPVLDDPYAMPDAAAVSDAAGACRALRPQVDLLVAMSPWNERAERSFLESSGAVADVLLGSGPAMGAGAKPMLGGRVLWVRSDFDGRSISVLDILARPAGLPWTWLEGVGYRYEGIVMGPEMPVDIQVNNIFSWF